MKRSIGVFLGAIAAAASLAACNNGNNNNNLPPGTGTNCGNPPFNMEVVYPKPNAHKVAPNLGGVVVAFNQSLPSGNLYDLWVNQSNGQSQYTSNNSGGPIYGPGSGFTSYNVSKIPNPHATPTYPNPHYYVTFFQPNLPIGPAQAVNLYWNDGGLNCNPNVIVSS
ncbi:MAG TPA: hypothetical protein VFE36_10125, partial [Candidatus Baltobacteraceae bacterium]|nr:hypothetical protein [Candidatus Baltobacteraceae bacterium]